MENYVYIVVYSFDSDRHDVGPSKTRHAVGPFKTRKEAWNAMLKEAQNEWRIAQEKNGWNSELLTGENEWNISLTVNSNDCTDVTVWLLYELRNANK